MAHESKRENNPYSLSTAILIMTLRPCQMKAINRIAGFSTNLLTLLKNPL
jgi:hypothetical protein